MARFKLVAAALFLAHGPLIAADCERQAREIYYSGSPETVYVATDQWTEVVFPEPLAGRLVEQREGLTVRTVPTFFDRFYLQAKDPVYVSTMFVHGRAGTSYQLKILGREGCADSTVTVRTDHAAPSAASGSPNVGADSANDSGAISRGSTPVTARRLMERMLTGQQPPRGYNRETPRGTLEDRLVFQQGPVSFYLQEVWRGRQYSGLILHAVNNGRTPYTVAVETIDFMDPRVRRALGRVREIAMQPIDRTLGPLPQYAADMYAATNQGLIYIVSERYGRP